MQKCHKMLQLTLEHIKRGLSAFISTFLTLTCVWAIRKERDGISEGLESVGHLQIVPTENRVLWHGIL